MKDWPARWFGCHMMLFLSRLQRGRGAEATRLNRLVAIGPKPFLSIHQDSSAV